MNKRSLSLLLMLVLIASLLGGCTGGNDSTRYVVNDPTAQPTQNALGSLNGGVSYNYDETYALEEEYADEPSYGIIGGSLIETPVEDYTSVYVPMYAPTATPKPTIQVAYAGATPVLLDPLDKPTATPIPSLNFDYVTYDASSVYLTFEGPAGWIIDTAAANTFSITNPATNVDYAANLSISVTRVSSDYTTNQLKSEVKQMMSTLNGYYNTFKSTSTAERSLLQANGIYADYTATTRDGVEIWGRVQSCCVNRNLYILHMSCPRAYSEQYKDTVYSQFRHSAKVI